MDPLDRSTRPDAPPDPAGLRARLQDALGPTIALGNELPRGGMSRVFVGFDSALQRKVAVKILAPDLPEALSAERFRREIMLAASLQHPNIVPVLSAGESDGLPYFIMPFVEGESLRTRLMRGPLSVRETVSIMRDVARALNLAHDHGIVHRDIKPDNVILTGGVAMVTDFGVAKALDAARRPGPVADRSRTPRSAITMAGTAIGTPAYMAPEQAAGESATDHRADLYALGILGYEMLTGTPPFRGNSARELMAAQLAGTPPPLERRRDDVPRELRHLIMECLQKEPDQRPRTATGVVRILENPDLVSGAYDAPRQGRGQRAARRREFVGAALVVLLLAGAGSVVWPVLVSRGTAFHPVDLGAMLLVPTLQSPGGDTAAHRAAVSITEQLVARLSQQAGFRVAGPPLADTLTGPPPDRSGPGGHRLRLEGLVEGSGSRLGLTVRLVDQAGFTLWGNTFRLTGRNPLQLQDSLGSLAFADLLPRLLIEFSRPDSTS